MRPFMLLVTLAVLAGCTTMDLGTVYTKPNAGVPELSRDEWECRRETADQPATQESWIGGLVDTSRLFEEAADRDRLLAECMQGRGYQVARPDAWYRPLMLHWN